MGKFFKYKYDKMIQFFSKNIFENFLNLGVSKFFELLVPLIVIPFLINNLGLDQYGEYIFIFSIYAVFSVFIRFGLDDYGVKKLTQSNLNEEKNISISFLLIKSFFALIVIFSTLLLCLFNELPLLYLLCSLVLLGDSLDSIWFFLARSNLNFYTATKLLTKSLYVFLIVLLINDSSDLILVPLCYAFAVILSGILQVIQMLKILKGSFNVFSVPKVCNEIFSSGFHIVGSNFISTIKDRGGFIALGLLGLNSFVAIFDIIFKIIMVLNIAPQIISTSYFPKVSKTKSRELLNESFLVIIVYSIFILPFLFLLQFLSNKFFGDLFSASFLLILTIFFCCFFYSLSVNIAKNIIIVSGKTDILIKSAVASSLIYLSTLFVLYYQNFDIYSAVLLLMIAYFIELSVRLIYVIWYKLYNI